MKKSKEFKHRQIRAIVANRLPQVLGGKLPFTPHPYQVEDLEKFMFWLQMENAPQRGYVEWATGLGKTFLFCTIIAACEGLRVLVIESGKQLVSQTAKEVVKFTEGSVVHASSVKEIVTPDGDEILRWKNGGEHSVLITTDESFKRSAEKFLMEFNPDVIIWDELHWGFTEKAQAALGMFPRALIVGFSATPDYLTTVAKSDFMQVTMENGQVLYADPKRMAQTHFGDRIAQRGLRWGIQNNWLAPLAWGAIDFGFSLDGVPVVNTENGFDYEESALHRVLGEHWHLVVDTIVKLYKSDQYDLTNRHVAVICPGVTQAEEITAAVKKLGIAAECITNKTKDDERERILQAADRGEVKFLASVFALREGWDCKLFEVALMLRPTRSRVLYIQFMGRVLRSLLDKIALIVDPFFLSTKFAPLSAPALFGEPGQKVTRGGVLIGPHGGKNVSSPYLVKLIENATPTLVIEHLEIEYWADESGFFEADGERWGTATVLAREIKVSYKVVNQHLPSCRTKEGKDVSGKVRTFYPLSDVRAACVKFLEVPQAGKDGFFEADGERWGTIRALAKELCISETSTRKMVDPNSCRNRQGRPLTGEEEVFYPLSDVRAACADLLSNVDLPQADSDGTFEADGESWATVRVCAKRFGLSATTVGKRIASCRSRKGKTLHGHRQTFYALSEARSVCADLLEVIKAGKDGFFGVDGVKWGTVEALARELKIAKESISLHLSSYRSQDGKASGGQRATFYALSDVAKACADLLQKKRSSTKK